MWNEKQRIASLHLAEILRPTPLPMTARSTSRLRASCCYPCGLAPVVNVAAGTRWIEPHLGVRPTLPAARGSSQLAAIAESLTCTKRKSNFIVVLIPKPFCKNPDKLIGKGCPTPGVLSTRYVERKTADSIAAPRRNFEADTAAP